MKDRKSNVVLITIIVIAFLLIGIAIAFMALDGCWGVEYDKREASSGDYGINTYERPDGELKIMVFFYHNHPRSYNAIDMDNGHWSGYTIDGLVSVLKDARNDGDLSIESYRWFKCVLDDIKGGK